MIFIELQVLHDLDWKSKTFTGCPVTVLRSVIHITCKSPSLQFKDLRTVTGHPVYDEPCTCCELKDLKNMSFIKVVIWMFEYK